MPAPPKKDYWAGRRLREAAYGRSNSNYGEWRHLGFGWLPRMYPDRLTPAEFEEVVRRYLSIAHLQRWRLQRNRTIVAMALAFYGGFSERWLRTATLEDVRSPGMKMCVHGWARLFGWERWVRWRKRTPNGRWAFRNNLLFPKLYWYQGHEDGSPIQDRDWRRRARKVGHKVGTELSWKLLKESHLSLGLPKWTRSEAKYEMGWFSWEELISARGLGPPY